MTEHPAEDLLELFHLRRLTADQMMAILRHLDCCRSCRDQFRQQRDYVEAMRRALQTLNRTDWV